MNHTTDAHTPNDHPANDHAPTTNGHPERPPALLARLDAADRLPGAAELRSWSYALLAPDRQRAAATVVDVGCGGGRAVAELGERGVPAVGVDPDERMIAAARARFPGADLRIGDAYALPLPDRSAGGYRAEKVFHELAEPERALAEARRVLAPGGRIVLLGQDWDTLVIDSDHPALTRTLVHARADRVTEPRAARRSRALLLDAGFADVRLAVRTLVLTGPDALPVLLPLARAAAETGAVTAEEADAWTADQRRRAERDRLLLALPILVASGTAPA
ncbi:methyltransferase domain-containing protein [Streptomyces triticirhizae]|uniref:Methyltransferase domain-containing protein n=1 Tax=Streptomyces triticirhizae TaxID=2483353 RepID=A0A3M2M970_9ACTN|nr:methyltransferase domain-containing protein [Streptomyces triticirhizae]RMI46011.1 methyltransferase domain-containing protein [Streptomyces triticirhizae]